MKLFRLFTIVLSLAVMSPAVFAQNTGKKDDTNKRQSKKPPLMVFKSTTHDFGTIERGGDGSYVFEFRNDGKAPLVVTNVRSSCGCTVPKWSKKPVPKKKKGAIKVKYDTNRMGSFSKTITVYSTAKNSPVTLNIRGNVVRKKPESEKSKTKNE